MADAPRVYAFDPEQGGAVLLDTPQKLADARQRQLGAATQEQIRAAHREERTNNWASRFNAAAAGAAGMFIPGSERAVATPGSQMAEDISEHPGFHGAGELGTLLTGEGVVAKGAEAIGGAAKSAAARLLGKAAPEALEAAGAAGAAEAPAAAAAAAPAPTLAARLGGYAAGVPGRAAEAAGQNVAFTTAQLANEGDLGKDPGELAEHWLSLYKDNLVPFVAGGEAIHGLAEALHPTVKAASDAITGLKDAADKLAAKWRGPTAEEPVPLGIQGRPEIAPQDDVERQVAKTWNDTHQKVEASSKRLAKEVAPEVTESNLNSWQMANPEALPMAQEGSGQLLRSMAEELIGLPGDESKDATGLHAASDTNYYIRGVDKAMDRFMAKAGPTAEGITTPSNSVVDHYLAADNLKTELQRLVARAPKDVNIEARDMVEDFQKGVAKYLESDQVWGGEQASFQQEKNAAYTKLISARDNLESDGFFGEAGERGREELIASPGKVHSMLEKGDAATNDVVFRHLDEFATAAEGFRDFQAGAEKLAYDGVEDSRTTELRQQLQDFRDAKKTASEYGGIADAAAAHGKAVEEYEKARDAYEAAKAKPEGAHLSTVAGLFALATGHKWYATLALAKRAAEGLKSGAGAEFVANRLATLKIASDRFEELLDRHADDLVKGVSGSRFVIPAVWTDAEFRKQQKEAQEAVGNPQAMVDNIHKGAGSMADAAPYTFGAFSTLAGDHTQMIADALTSPILEGFLPQQWVTSPTERQQAQQIVQAVQNPLYPIAALSAGVATPKMMQAWMKAWPHIANKYQVKVSTRQAAQLAKEGRALAIPMRRQNSYALLGLGAPSSMYTPHFIQSMQGVYALKATQQGPPGMAGAGSRGGPGSRGGTAGVGKITLSTQMLTPTQRAAQRTK